MRVGVQESEFVRPSLNRNAKKRHHTICSQHGELLEYMYQDDDFERIRRRYNQAHPFDVHDEAINPDGEWEEYNWCHDELWQELMHDSDPDPMGAMMAAMGRYLLFYRYQHNVENLGSNRKYNNGQPSLRSHSIPCYYRQLTAAYPSWNEGITSVGSGCNNLLAKYPTWKMFLEDVNAILSCGRYADIKRAQPVFGPLRQQISATLPPFSVGLATMLLNGIIQNNAIRATTALSVELADVYEMEEADDRSDGGSRGGLMYRDNLLCAHSYGAKKSTDLHVEQTLVMPGNNHGDAGWALRRWLRARLLIEPKRNSNLLVNWTTEAYQMFLMRSGGYAGLPCNWLKTTGYKVAKITEMFLEALMLGKGISFVGVKELVNIFTGHREGSMASRTYLRNPLHVTPQLIKSEGITSVDQLEMRHYYSELPLVHPRRRRRIKFEDMSVEMVHELNAIHENVNRDHPGHLVIPLFDYQPPQYDMDEEEMWTSAEIQHYCNKLMNEIARAWYSKEDSDFYACVMDNWRSNGYNNDKQPRNTDKRNVFRCLVEMGEATCDTVDLFEAPIADWFRRYWRLDCCNREDLPAPTPPPEFDVSGTTNMRLCCLHYLGRRPNQGHPYIPIGSRKIYLHSCNKAQIDYTTLWHQRLRCEQFNLAVFDDLRIVQPDDTYLANYYDDDRDIVALVAAASAVQNGGGDEEEDEEMEDNDSVGEEDRINFGGDSDAEDEADDLSYVPDYRLSGSEDESDGDVETEYERSTHSSGVSGLHDVLEYERLPNSSESDGAEAMNEDEYGLC